MTTPANVHLCELLIWWILPDSQPRAPLPPYVWRELESLAGRNARQRLWVPGGIQLEDPPLPEVAPGWNLVDHRAGGIVFLRPDLEVVRLAGLGIVTDFDLEVIWSPNSLGVS